MDFNSKYKQMVRYVLDNGHYQECRNGEQIIVPNYSFTVNWKDWRLDLRKMWYKGVFGEFKTLISKEPLTNVSQFEANGCNYWKDWADPDGSLNLDYYNKLHPQLEDVIENIKIDPNSRRHVIDLWQHENVQGNKLSLPVCWFNLIFTVIGDEIHLTWTQRSGDLCLGIPSDVYLGHLFLDYVARKTGFIPATMTFNIANLHIYTDHLENAKALLKRTTADWNRPLKFELKA